MFDPAAPALYRGQSQVSRFARTLLHRWFTRKGWQAEGTLPPTTRFVLVALPHTTNWDLPFFLGASQALGIKPSFMAKDALFRWPLGRLMRRLGGIPVIRSRSTNAVAQMIAEFGRRETFMLTIAPEGTRSRVEDLKTGFYQIALGAGVPIVCGFLDYQRKRGGIGPWFMPSGDYAADLALMRSFYRTTTPRHPEKTCFAAE